MDLTGQKFGRLTAQHYDVEQKKWHCVCDCGNEKKVTTADLKRGHTKSCGCYRNEQARKAVLNDLTGKKFGELVVIERDMSHQGHGSRTHWFCKCEKCGNIKSISTSSLISQKIVSCGCIKSKGEYKIAELLTKHSINFITEYKFSDCKNRRYDFAILNKHNEVIRLIEFDGLQHFYKPRAEHWSATSSLEETQARDLEKNEIAKQHNIPLVRIPYWKLANLSIIQLLDNTFVI